ncbi:MAG: Rhodanese-related sulfurtransferase [Acidimicrobiaceae bacterium]|jgi:rhodanese-related sulfurtransferase/predicted metal-dependent enzyme (double-stranded beta helix superfamily)|nr:Rhodanese-related sulfurtransferase [Acidimicrobiaceae bacterium]
MTRAAPQAPAAGSGTVVQSSSVPRGGLEPGIGVNAERQAQILAHLDQIAPRSGRLSPPQLRAVTTAIAARRDLWQDLVVHDPDTRWYLPLYRSSSYDVWLLAWERGQDTDWHDHGGSSGSFAVAEGALREQYRTASGRRLVDRHLAEGAAAAFGPAHVHDVRHEGDGQSTSIHAYSPPLVAMTYYSRGPHGLIARETVGVDGPEGSRGRGGYDAVVEAAKDAPLMGRSVSSIDELLAQARSDLLRLGPEATAAAIADGAVLVDIRPVEQRIEEGEVPGAVVIARNVLEWRLDPRSDARIPALARADAHIVVMCSEGYASSLAASSLRSLGIYRATDLDGGYQAWRRAGLPTRLSSAR